MKELDFLRGHLPQSDLDGYGDDLLRQFAEHGLMLRREVSWCAALEQELFEHYVLCPRVNDEDLSFYSEGFFDALWKRILPLESMEDRILEVNRWCGEHANYQMQDERTASALTVYRNGSGRCGEESVFLVAALRSVGIPARQVYAPRWAHCDDNHAWVEAWCDGAWRFLGACEPEPVLDRGWFNTPASRALLVHSRIFGESDSAVHGEFLCKEGAVSWYNQTKRYALTRQYQFCVRKGDEPAAGAKLYIQVLNEASFHTIAALTADEQGKAKIEMGLGDFHVLAVRDGLRAEADCRGTALTLHLQPTESHGTPWETFDVRAPRSSDINESYLDAAQKRSRAADREKCTAARKHRESDFQRAAAAKSRWKDLLVLARGNAGTIGAFLEPDGHPNREALLLTLTEKDLRDVTMEVLEDHFHHSPAQGDLPWDIYRHYVLCPRIGTEPLRPWRQALQKELADFRERPVALWEHLADRMDTYGEGNYDKLYQTPMESWKAGRCDEKSRKLLFVAALRSLGIPARLRPMDSEPEFWHNGVFVTACPEEKGMLRLTCRDPLVYRQDWTLSRWTGEEWKLLYARETDREIPLPAGVYRLITTRRMPGGNQYAARRELVISPGQVTESDLYLRSYALVDMLGSQKLPAMIAAAPDGREMPVVTEKPGLLLWLEEGTEPTEHLVRELMEQRPALGKLPATLTILLRSEESLRDPALGRLLKEWPGIRVLLDDWAYDLETVARYLTCDPDTPPLAVACDEKGMAVFGVSGYRVGVGRLLAEIAAYMAENRGK